MQNPQKQARQAFSRINHIGRKKGGFTEN